MEGGHDPFASLGSAKVSAPIVRGKVNFDYTSQIADQISLKAGWIIDIVTLGERGGWTKGRDLQGNQHVLIYFSSFSF